MVIDSTNNLIELYIDNNASASLSLVTNVISPRTSTYNGACAMCMGIQKTAGTTNTLVVADYIGHKYTGTGRI